MKNYIFINYFLIFSLNQFRYFEYIRLNQNHFIKVILFFLVYLTQPRTLFIYSHSLLISHKFKRLL